MNRTPAIGRARVACTALAALALLPACTMLPRSAEQELADRAVTEAVRTALVVDPEASGQQIAVDTRRRLVILEGLVDSYEQKSRVTRLVLAVEGVKDVDNDLLVRQ